MLIEKRMTLFKRAADSTIQNKDNLQFLAIKLLELLDSEVKPLGVKKELLK